MGGLEHAANTLTKERGLERPSTATTGRYWRRAPWMCRGTGFPQAGTPSGAAAGGRPRPRRFRPDRRPPRGRVTALRAGLPHTTRTRDAGDHRRGGAGRSSGRAWPRRRLPLQGAAAPTRPVPTIMVNADDNAIVPVAGGKAMGFSFAALPATDLATLFGRTPTRPRRRSK